MARDNECLRALIVDDERPARREMKRMLGKIEGLEIIGEAGDGLAAISLIEEHRPDIILLDIQMPGLDGFQVIERLKGSGELPSIIFVTAYDQYAIKAFEVHAVDYLLKPVDEDRLARAIEHVRRIRTGLELGPDLAALMQTIRAAPRRLAVRRGDSHVFVDESDILYATISAGDVIVVTGELEGEAGFRSLDELQRELGPDRFFRVHRSYLANVERIHEITPWFSGRYQLRMGGSDGPVIPLSRSQAGKLRELLKW